MREAKVACRQLGYPDAVKALEAHEFTPGSGPIWLDNVDCSGLEPNITSCSHNGWGKENCWHGKHAGVECSTPGRATAENNLFRCTRKDMANLIFAGQDHANENMQK